MCDGLKAAIEKGTQTKAGAEAQAEPTGTPAEQAAAEESERKELMASIGVVCEQNQVSGDELRDYCIKMKILKAGQKLNEAATAKLKAINKSVQNPATIAEIKKLAGKAASS
jgi:hypothetical protein